MKVIGITGSSGSGKSTVTNILGKELNANVINADLVAKQMQTQSNKYYEKIIELFGNDIILEDNTLNRRKIAEIIYKDSTKREKLNNITFKYVVEEVKTQVKASSEEYVIIDAPLLIESGLSEICNTIIAIISNKKEQVKRICQRDNIEEKEATLRLASQQSNEFYTKNADYIVENNGGNYDEFMGGIRELVQKLQQV